MNDENFSDLFANNVVQVRNANIGFDQGDLIHLFRERPLFYVVFDPDIVVWCWTALGNKYLLWKEERERGNGRS